ncbi:hypothetical protein AB0D45_19220, partial [Streptomyces sp. NPDC048352]|uniref:hypothetical protein n=1 Tax=Streptomyces sp. NPDC048352 TaxID=3154718 RepID=UPI003415FD04
MGRKRVSCRRSHGGGGRGRRCGVLPPLARRCRFVEPGGLQPYAAPLALGGELLDGAQRPGQD